MIVAALCRLADSFVLSLSMSYGSSKGHPPREGMS